MLKKRFIRFVFVLLLGSFAFAPVAAQEIGLQLYSLRNQFKNEVPGTFALLKKWKIREIEAGGTQGLPLDEYKKILAENNLVTIGVGADYQQLRDNPLEAVKAAKTFGAKYVVCYWIPHNGTLFTMDETSAAVAVFNAAGKVLLENGLTFCYHPHGYEFRPFEGGTYFDFMVSATDPKYVNYEMDVFWVKHPGQDPVALLKKYPGRFKLMHLKDRRIGTENSQTGTADDETNVVLGTGDVGIAEIMAAAKTAGIEHYFIEDESSHSVEQIPLSLEFLKARK